jgi:hypothetical protein
MQQFLGTAAGAIVDGIDSGKFDNFIGKDGFDNDFANMTKFGPMSDFAGYKTEAVGTVATAALDMGVIQLPPGFKKQKFPGFEEKKKEDKGDK